MAKFEMHILSATDGSWDRFRGDWQGQCGEVGDTFEDYAPDSLKVVAEVVAESLLGVGGDNLTRIGALWDAESERYYACCMLNRARLPGTEGRTLRIRHLIVSPLLDYGVAEVSLYPDVLIGILSSVVHLSETEFGADHIRFHLRSPEDQAFLRCLGPIWLVQEFLPLCKRLARGYISQRVTVLPSRQRRSRNETSYGSADGRSH